jgi:large subunit ribosomal protein L18
MSTSQGPQRAIRHRRIRMRVRGTAARPRLSVFRSARHMTAQLIDDAAGRTLVSVSDTQLPHSAPPPGGASHFASEATRDKSRGRPKGAPRTSERTAGVARAFAVGQLLASKATERGITMVVFDRGGYAYHGQVKAVAEGARLGGVKF